jgi:hypothetical protein
MYRARSSPTLARAARLPPHRGRPVLPCTSQDSSDPRALCHGHSRDTMNRHRTPRREWPSDPAQWRAASVRMRCPLRPPRARSSARTGSTACRSLARCESAVREHGLLELVVAQVRAPPHPCRARGGRLQPPATAYPQGPRNSAARHGSKRFRRVDDLSSAGPRGAVDAAGGGACGSESSAGTSDFTPCPCSARRRHSSHDQRRSGRRRSTRSGSDQRGTTDVIDASVVLRARIHGHRIATSDLGAETLRCSCSCTPSI